MKQILIDILFLIFYAIVVLTIWEEVKAMKIIIEIGGVW